MRQQETYRTVEELAAEAGATARTVRYYIAEGLLPGPFGRGRATIYGEEHLLRLRLIRCLVEQRVPLAEVREQVTRLTIEEVRALLPREERRTAERDRARASQSPAEYVAALLERSSSKDASPLVLRAAPARPAPPAATAMPPRTSAPAPKPVAPGPAEQWGRWELAPGVELNLRHDAPGPSRSLVERILRLAGKHPADR